MGWFGAIGTSVPTETPPPASHGLTALQKAAIVGSILVVVLVVGVFVGLFYLPGSISSVALLQHPKVIVSGTITMTGTDSPTPTGITFTDVDDIANTGTGSITSSGYSVTVPNGHSYNIRIDYSYSYQYQYHCYDYNFNPNCPLYQGDYCSFDYVVGNSGYWSCTHSETRNSVCRGGPLKVNVAADSMTFNIQCT